MGGGGRSCDDAPALRGLRAGGRRREQRENRRCYHRHRPVQTDPTASAPKFLGKYEVLARLDSGGMAEIFLARARALAGFEKLVVLKRILPHLAAEEEFVSLFLDEAKTTVALSHGNVVQVFDMGKDADGDYFIAMDYVAWKNLGRFT